MLILKKRNDRMPFCSYHVIHCNLALYQFAPQVGLDDTQLEGIRRVKALSFGGSRLQFLDELSTPRGGPATENSSKTSPSWRSSGSVSGNQDIWSSQNFALKLAPPTIEFEGEANW